jgi:hypothetical protein
MDISLINNPWVIGILGGLIVTAMSRYLFSKRDNKEYRQKIVTANQEILYAIRPGVSEGKLASLEVFKSLVAATSSKYNVEEYDLYKPRDIANHLIKEVMDSSFISVELKHQYCDALASLKEKDVQLQPIDNGEKREEQKSDLSEYRQKLISMLSVMLGVITAIMTIFVVFIDKYKDGFDKDISILIPTLVVTFTILITTMLIPLFRQITKEKKKHSIKKEKLQSNVADEENNT